MSAFFFVFPAMLLSGFAFPIENMPETVQWLTFLNPLRYYLIIIRGVFLKGVGFHILWPEMLGLFLIGAIILLFAVQRFQKTLRKGNRGEKVGLILNLANIGIRVELHKRRMYTFHS
jgi:ABC-2 type transport system permease protein